MDGQRKWMMAGLIVAVLAVSGCASVRPASFATEQAVRTAQGEPTSTWLNADGTRTLEYATQPHGTTCWRYIVNEQGQVVAQYDALSSENLRRVRKGMTTDEVRSLLCPERSIQQFRGTNEEVWDWNIGRGGYAQTASRFNVHFKDGLVVRTSYEQLYPPPQMHFGIGFGRGVYPGWGMGWGYPYRPWGYPYW